MAAEKRKWYRGMMIGEGNYLFAIPMSVTEANIFFDILSRVKCAYDGGYSPCLDMDKKAYDTPNDIGKTDYDWWDNFPNYIWEEERSQVASIGRNDKPMIFEEDEQDDEQ